MSEETEFDAGGGAIVRRLLLEEIKRIVLDAKRNGETLRTSHHASLLFASYPHVFSVGRIIDELVLAATREKVAVEISRPEHLEPHF